MNIYFNCHSLYLQYGLDSLIKENINTLMEKVDNLCIYDISTCEGGFSLMVFIDDNFEYLCESKAKILVIKKRGCVPVFNIKGIFYINSDSTLKEWRHTLSLLTKGPVVNSNTLLRASARFNLNMLTGQEVYLLQCLGMSLDLCTIASVQGVSIKRCYAMLYSIRDKLALNSVREIHLNIGQINDRLIDNDDTYFQLRIKIK